MCLRLCLGWTLASVSVEASFFELGGNSLRAVLLARRLSEALGREVGMAEVLQRPTVAALAAALPMWLRRCRHWCVAWTGRSWSPAPTPSP